MENIKKKIIPGKTAVKAFINGFVSYGIIFSFIIIVVIALFRLIVNSNVNEEFFYMIVNSILKSIVFFFLLLLLCRISTYDVLKKCKIKKDDIDNINKNMTKFFLICCLFSLMIFTCNLSVKYLNMKTDLYQISINNYNSFRDTDLKVGTALTDIQITKYKNHWTKYKVCSTLTEVAIIASCVYLISYQKKMIELYNV